MNNVFLKRCTLVLTLILMTGAIFSPAGTACAPTLTESAGIELRSDVLFVFCFSFAAGAILWRYFSQKGKKKGKKAVFRPNRNIIGILRDNLTN